MNRPRQRNQLRIIAGQWRGRKLNFPDLPELRPTPDRVRETLFNWLQVRIVGSRCLDLFAGSGALGFEAVSRGAVYALLLDTDPLAIQTMRLQAERLQTQQLDIRQGDGLALIQQPATHRFDIVFLDPPYAKHLVPSCIQCLDKNHWLNSEAWVYFELPVAESLPDLPTHWSLYRQQRAGQITYHLAHYQLRP